MDERVREQIENCSRTFFDFFANNFGKVFEKLLSHEEKKVLPKYGVIKKAYYI